MKPRAWIFDLDGTLADQTHRQHLAKEKKWDEYFNNCVDDTLIQEVYHLLTVLDCGPEHILICSGRSDSVRNQTNSWLERHFIYPDAVFMRRSGDHRPDWLVKEEMYFEKIEPRYEVVGIFDDRDQVVNMWRRNGLRCYQVAPGNF